MIDLHFVAPGLAVGARFPPDAAAVLARQHGITRVVDVRVEECDDERVLRRHGIRLLHLPTEDTRAISLERIRHGVRFVSEGLDRGEGVLVHCQYGIGRSALLALCVLVDRGAAPLEAMERAKAARSIVSPSPDQLEAFLAFAAEVKAGRGAPWPVPTVREVGRIAWRHLFEGEDAAAASTRRTVIRRPALLGPPKPPRPC